MEALHDVVKAGKVRYIGASSMWAWQFAKMQHATDLGGWTRFVAMENQYNLLKREEEREMLPLCADMGVGCVPYSPLGKGRLARPWGQHTQRGDTDQVAKSFDLDVDQPVVEAVQQIAEERGVPMAQITMAWVLSEQASGHRPHRRRDQAPSASRRSDRRGDPADRGGDPPSRRALHDPTCLLVVDQRPSWGPLGAS